MNGPSSRLRAPFTALAFGSVHFVLSACSSPEAVIANRADGKSGSGGDGGSSGSGTAGTATMPPPPPPACEPKAERETACTDGVDDDCDAKPDCLDEDCDGKSCGGDGSVCTAGGCVCEGCSLPELPTFDNVRVTMHGDTAIVEFEPIDAARDYRIYPLPNPDSVRLDDGRPVVENAIYRCAGDRSVVPREFDQIGSFGSSIEVNSNVFGYARKDEEKLLGYVYLTPGEGRTAVYRVADPNGGGGHAWDYTVGPSAEYYSADYVTSKEARDALLAKGWRDDGIVFYVPDAGTRPVYRRQYESDFFGSSPTFFYLEGAEYDLHAGNDDTTTDFGERFRVLEAPADGAVPLYRVLYLGTNAFDVLAAGEARFERALYQGAQPIWSLTWPGLTKKTTLVIEALDEGCPFPGGYVSAEHADDADQGERPSITLDEARLPETGEVFINGQHDMDNRPAPVARSYVDVTPEPDPEMDWFEGFDEGVDWPNFDVETIPNWGVYYRRSENWAIDFGGCTTNNTIGPLLGQLVFGGGDGGSSCNMSISPRNVTSEVSAGKFLHVRMATDLPSTFRRYPQILITTAPIVDPGSLADENQVPVRNRLGPLPFEEDYEPGSGTEHTIIVQPFSSSTELQIEFCDRRGWGVSIQCPRANIYGYHAGDYQAEWEHDWYPVPVLGEITGHDRPVQFDVYASTERVYVFLDEKPAGCAVLPSGQMPAGPVTVVFGAVGYHLGIDEPVDEHSAHQYLHEYSLTHDDHTFDDLGISNAVDAPAWDEERLPCGDRWYGAEE